MPKKKSGSKLAVKSVPSADIAADDTNTKEAPSKSTGKRASALQPRTPEDIANEQTAVQLALRLWVAMVGETLLSSMSALADELLTSSLFDDDDDEESDDEGWFDDHREREKKSSRRGHCRRARQISRHQCDQ
jgi:hypothetical protein